MSLQHSIKSDIVYIIFDNNILGHYILFTMLEKQQIKMSESGGRLKIIANKKRSSSIKH